MGESKAGWLAGWCVCERNEKKEKKGRRWGGKKQARREVE
jgi:hypothetical protein